MSNMSPKSSQAGRDKEGGSLRLSKGSSLPRMCHTNYLDERELHPEAVQTRKQSYNIFLRKP